MRTAGSVALLGALVPAAGLAASSPAKAAGTPARRTRYAQIRRVCPPPAPGRATCLSLARVPVASAASPGAQPYTQNDGAASSGPAEGLTPAQLASAYGYDPNAGGSGQTVAVVDAYDDPDVERDLSEFDKNYGLAECTSEDGCLEKVGQTGSATSLPEADTSGWSLEISLDVETVHSVCPNCKILLVEADSESDKDLAAAANEAVALGATEVSNSYAGPEAELGPPEEAAYDHPGIPIVAATGDEGYDGWAALNEGIEPPGMPDAPASLPSVVAVGGTSLSLTASGARASETVWNDEGPEDLSGLDLGVTGGGCSTLFSAQPWQQDAPGFAATGCVTKRLVSDVSAVADPLTGFAVYDTYECGLYCSEEGLGEGWLPIGGTSLATPLIASLYALAGGGHEVPYPALTLYGHLAGHSSLYDVTEGGNGFCDGEPDSQCEPEPGLGDCEGTTACDAAPGFDGPSGVGAPSGLGLFEPLLPTAVITPPASLTEGTAASFSAEASSDPYPGGSIAEYSWDWGDEGETSSGAAPEHTYGEAGTYTVTLTVTDNYGLTSASSTVSVNVSAGEAEEAATAQQQESPPAAGGQGTAGFQSNTQRPVPDAKLASTALAASASGAVTVKVSCPAGESSCSGTVTLRTLAAVSAGAGRAAKKKASILTLASGSFTVAGGRVKTVTLHLSAKARRLLARSHPLRVRATIVAHDPAGTAHTTQTLVTLRAPKRKQRKG